MYEDEEEPSVLEYARFHGLIEDHRRINPLDLITKHPQALVLEDDSHLPQITTEVATLPCERLVINSDALRLLSSITYASKELLQLDASPLLDRHHRIEDMKLELPLLRTDHDDDMRRFGLPFVPDLSKETMNAAPLDDEQIGLAWPSNPSDLLPLLMKHVEPERLIIPKDAFLYLQDVLENSTREVSPDSFFELKKHQQNTLRNAITSSTTSRSTELTPLIPPSAIGRKESHGAELVPCNVSPSNELGTLIRKRKTGLQEQTPTRHTLGIAEYSSTLDSRLSSGDLLGNSFSVSNAIDEFVAVQTGKTKRQMLTKSEFFLDNVGSGPKVDSRISLREPKIPASTSNTNNVQKSLPNPGFIVPNSPRSFVVSLTLINQRNLFRLICLLYPNAQFIERDFTIHLPKFLNNGGSLVTNTEEADLVISTSTGIILTTLTRLHQRSRPGSPKSCPLYTRIVLVAQRYSTLMVLVSQAASKGDPIPLSSSDCSAITQLTSFCRSSQFSASAIDVRVLFVPGDEENLARWIVDVMIRYGGNSKERTLLQDETIWEMFLRLSNLNAFAAQAILAELNALNRDGAESGEYGLAAFMKMTVKERIRLFGSVCDEALIRRVSHVLDFKWT